MSDHARWETIKARAGREFIDQKIHWLEGYITGLKNVREFWCLTEDEREVLPRVEVLISQAEDTLQALKDIPKEDT